MSDLEHYRTLGVKPGATLAEIMHAYRLLAKTYHPDSASGRGNASAFVRVVNAYQSLAARQRAAVKPASRAHSPHPKPASAPAREAKPAAGSARSQRKPSADVFALGKTLLFDARPLERVRAARLMGWSGKRACYAFLRKALWDRDEQVRIAAVRAVGLLGIRQSSGELASLFTRSVAAVRREVIAAVGRIGAGDGFSSVVKLALRDADPGVRAAARALWKSAK